MTKYGAGSETAGNKSLSLTVTDLQISTGVCDQISKVDAAVARRMLQTLLFLQCKSQRPALHRVRSSAYQAFQFAEWRYAKRANYFGFDFSSL
jgi:hypothetical protein